MWPGSRCRRWFLPDGGGAGSLQVLTGLPARGGNGVLRGSGARGWSADHAGERRCSEGSQVALTWPSHWPLGWGFEGMQPGFPAPSAGHSAGPERTARASIGLTASGPRRSQTPPSAAPKQLPVGAVTELIADQSHISAIRLPCKSITRLQLTFHLFTRFVAVPPQSVPRRSKFTPANRSFYLQLPVILAAA